MSNGDPRHEAPCIGLIDGQVDLGLRGGCHACSSSVRVKGIPTRSASAAARPDRLPRLQQLETLLHGLLRFATQGGLVIVGQRVRQHDHWIPGHAADVRHGLRRVHKPVRDDRRGRDAGFFRCQRIVYTTRGAAASITHARNDGVAHVHRRQHLGGHWTAGIGLLEA
jgi:hypothetical protein